MSTDRNRHLKITLAALTRRRPEMLDTLVASWRGMDIPQNTDVTFLIIENDETPQSKSHIERFEVMQTGARIHYVHEPELGIPFARNRAAKEAIAQAADLLAFVDDDEVVAQDWLVEHVETYRNGEAVLIGGPMRLLPPDPGFSKLEKVMHANLVANLLVREKENAAKVDEGKHQQLDIFTGNWMGETRIFSELGLWFDESMRFTGGTDSKFSTTLKSKGQPVGWARRAYAYEAYPQERLSFAYQYGRARDQYNNLFHERMKARPLSRYSLILRLPRKLLEILWLLVSVLITRGKTLLKLAKTTGWVSGRVGAAFGQRSKLYNKITGD